MAHLFLSDTHLRLDRPDRGERLARLVSGLKADDCVVVGGDLCDFWFASRQRRTGVDRCRGMEALHGFRERGGSLILLPGNHDAWLGPFYERHLGTAFQQEPLDLTIGGLRIRVIHGHRILHRWRWKYLLESRAFHTAFSATPGFVARRLDGMLEAANSRGIDAAHDLLLGLYREYVKGHAGSADLFLFGHVHARVDETIGAARLIVLGDWKRQASYLRVDEEGVAFLVEADAP